MSLNQKTFHDLIEHYLAHRISSESFSDNFVDLFYETKRESFSTPEKEILLDLVEWLKRFSPFEEDLKQYPNVYIDEKTMYRLVENAREKTEARG